MKTRLFHCLLWIALPLLGLSQQADLPLNHHLYHYIDRLDIQGRIGKTVHTDVKPYSRAVVAELLQSADTAGMNGNILQWHRLNRILGDDAYANAQDSKGLLKYFYKNKRDLYHVKTENFQLFLNPTLYLSAGIDQHDFTTTGATENRLNYRNTRGLRARGSLFDKVGFYTEVSENQWKAPTFVRNQYAELDALTGEGFVKEFDLGTGNSGFDYFNARGYITYSPVQQFRIKLGKDRAFWGNGYQSLLLSDQSNDYFFLNLTTRIWKLEYVNTFAQMTDFIRNKPDSYGIYPKKYAVFHQLFYKPTHWASIGLFESVVYSPTLPGGRRGLELEYLNPIIFYRSVEQALGSPDNSMLGLTWKFNFLKRFQHYGQIMLDDFNFRVRDQGTGYVGNKYGYQLGLKYIDAFSLQGLDLQVEVNRIRPYTYSHFNPTGNYAHYGQYLAHGNGANLQDLNLILRYQPFARWHVQGAFTTLLKGLDTNGLNYGGNVFEPYTSSFQDFNNTVGQGAAWRMTQLYGRISYQLLSLDAFAELEGRYRKENDNTSVSIMGTLRFNLPTAPLRY